MESITLRSLLRTFGWCAVLLLVSTKGWGQEGSCTSGNCVNGQGTFTYANGNSYVGEYRNGKRHGQGTYTYADGGGYVGEWKDDKNHGQGIYTYANGNSYVGEFSYGLFNGQGTYTWSDGAEYVGEYRDGERYGQGTFTERDGSVLSGMWIDDIWIDGANQEESKKEVLEPQKASCTSFGFTPGSDAHAECVMQMFIAEQAEANSAIER